MLPIDDGKFHSGIFLVGDSIFGTCFYDAPSNLRRWLLDPTTRNVAYMLLQATLRNNFVNHVITNCIEILHFANRKNSWKAIHLMRKVTLHDTQT